MTAFEQPPNVDDTLSYVTYLMLDRLHALIPNYQLYAEGEQ